MSSQAGPCSQGSNEMTQIPREADPEREGWKGGSEGVCVPASNLLWVVVIVEEARVHAPVERQRDTGRQGLEESMC